jgi:hypothetical protein
MTQTRRRFGSEIQASGGEVKDLRLKRPMRLWVAALMNILVGVISLAALVFISTSARVPDAVRFGGSTAVLAAITASFLVGSSVLALLGKPRGRQLMLAAALAFYGSILLQNAYMLIQFQGSLVPTNKLTANVVRSGLEIAINLWALHSAKTRKYFRALAAP